MIKETLGIFKILHTAFDAVYVAPASGELVYTTG